MLGIIKFIRKLFMLWLKINLFKKLFLGLLFYIILFILYMLMSGYSLWPLNCPAQSDDTKICVDRIYHMWPFSGISFYACYCVHK